MYSRILVAIDGSPHSDHALKHAVGLAEGLSAKLRIIHVFDIGLLPFGPDVTIDIDALLDARHAAAEKILDTARDRAQAQAQELDVDARMLDTTLPSHNVAMAIVGAAADWPADLIVLGTHGRRGMERWLLGSVAEGVTRRAPLPVLLVPMPG